MIHNFENSYSQPLRLDRPNCQAKQKGVTVFIVLVMLILGLISVLSALRVGILNEAFVGNDSDAQRTYAAAEAMMRDALIDVRGKLDNGADCNPAPNTSGCRSIANPYLVNYRDEYRDIEPVRQIIGAATCAQGICAPRTGLLGAFWNNQATLDAMKPTGATYGQFTGTVADAGNPLLSRATPKAWYWIEQYDYAENFTVPTNNLPVPDTEFSFVMRVTVLAEGNKPGTRTILQSYVVPRPKSSVPT